MRDHEKSRLRRTGTKLARAAAAFLFGASALLKLLGFEAFVNLFQGTDLYSPAMRYVVGSLELTGAILVLRERSALLGALMLFGVTLFAAFHVVSTGQSPLPLSLLAALTGGLIIVEYRRRRLRAGRGQLG